jgi:hypothetical protein
MKQTALYFVVGDKLKIQCKQLTTQQGKYFDWFKDELQNYYPCYFEKFRTDGIEYDIYIGQSIAPQKPFTFEHLQHFRLLQLKAMAAVAKITSGLYPTLEYPLQTTQLIFVNTKVLISAFVMMKSALM